MNLQDILDRLYHAATHGDVAETERLIERIRENARWNAHCNSINPTRLHDTLVAHGHPVSTN